MLIRRASLLLLVLVALVPLAPAHAAFPSPSVVGDASFARAQASLDAPRTSSVVSPHAAGGTLPVVAAQAAAGTTTITDTRTLYRTDSAFADSAFAPKVPRSRHTATTLPDGKVLIVGGYNGRFLSIAELYDPAKQTFTRTGGMVVPRADHTATLLPDGKVLIVGGHARPNVSLASAEVYDPATGTFSLTASMSRPRADHSATLLPDGKVLIAGGFEDALQAVASAELYDPVTATFRATGDMERSRAQHTATLLRDGTVLVAGGQSDRTLRAVAIYDPSSGTFRSTNPMESLRAKHTATLLRDGRVLVVGTGSTLGEIYNPANQSWTPTDSRSAFLSGHTATLLPNGQVLVVGVGRGVFRYDPATNTFLFTGTASLNISRTNHTTSVLGDGSILVVGGSDVNSNGYHASAERAPTPTSNWKLLVGVDRPLYQHTATRLQDGRVLLVGESNNEQRTMLYDPATDTVTPTGRLNIARFNHTATLLRDGNVLIAGGVGTNRNTIAEAEIYDPTTGTFASPGSMRESRSEHTATLLLNGKVLLLGGSTRQATDTGSHGITSAEVYDPATGTFTLAGTMRRARIGHTMTLLSDGKVLVTGGFSAGDSLKSAVVYDPTTATFTATGDMSEPRQDHTATRLQDGRVLIVGGGNDSFQYEGSAQLYDPATGTWSVPITIRPRYKHTATLLFDGTVLIAGGQYPTYNQTSDDALRFDPATEQFETLPQLLLPRRDHTATRLNDGRVLLAGGFAGRFELVQVDAANTFTGALTLPAGWVNTATPTVTVTAVTTRAPLVSGTVNDGAPFALRSGVAVTTTIPTLQDGLDRRISLTLRDETGDSATVVTGTVDVDTGVPASSMVRLPTYSPATVTLGWSGSDATSGVAGYDVDVRDDGGPWTRLLSNTNVVSATFTGSDGHRYEFRVRARDVAGNVEAWSENPDTSTTVDATGPVGAFDISFVGQDTVQVLLTATDARSGVAEMRVGFASTFGQAPWEPFASSKVLSRQGVPAGCQSVQVQYRDRVGNTSPIYAKPVPDAGCSDGYRTYLPLVRR